MLDIKLQAESVSPKPRIRLEFLDGLRGLAALYVVLFHVYGEVAWSYDASLMSPGVAKLLGWLNWGHLAVVAFIVLSGYCLMLPIARSGGGGAKLDLVEFFKRRARRILPPYYAALFATLALISIVPGLQTAGKHYVRWDSCLPALTWPAALSHIFLVHNLNGNWIYKINNPMWSVATEWQIYFLFATVLLPIWRRCGNLATVCTGFGLGLSIHFLSHHRLSLACPWFIGCFAVGMAAAAIGFSDSAACKRVHAEIRWGAVTAGLALLTIIIYAFIPRLAVYGIAMDILISLLAGSLIITCADHAHLAADHVETTRPLVLRCLESRTAVGLGTFSYSLYLVHYPILGALHLLLRTLHFSPNLCLLWLMLAGLPLSLIIAYGFHLMFEKPFMSSSSTKRIVCK